MQKTYFASEKSLLWLQKYFSKKFKLVIDISCIIPYNPVFDSLGKIKTLQCLET